MEAAGAVLSILPQLEQVEAAFGICVNVRSSKFRSHCAVHDTPMRFLPSGRSRDTVHLGETVDEISELGHY